MVDPRANSVSTDAFERHASADDRVRAFEPKAPEPLPANWDEASPPVSHPPLRKSRRPRPLPWLVGLLVIAGAGAVGHHWYQRLNASVPAGVATTDVAARGPDEPFSLRAAWRDVERRNRPMPGGSSSKVTPVTSVLDDVGGAAPAPHRETTAASGALSPAALLAEQMAAAAASDAVGARDQNPPAGNGPERSGASQQSIATPPDLPMGKGRPPEASPRATAGTTHVPAAAPEIITDRRLAAPQPSQPAPKGARVPGMVGLGGPPAAEDDAAAARPVVGRGSPAPISQPSPQKRSARETAPPSAARRTSKSASGGQTASSRSVRPRKPLRRGAAEMPSTQPPADPPMTGMSVFRRLERAMP